MITNVNDYDEILVQLRRRYNLEEFREGAQIGRGTFADDLVERIHRTLFVYSFDLMDEYQRFYGAEYDTFSAFLLWRYEPLKGLIPQIETNLADRPFVAYCREEAYLLADKTMISILDKILSNIGEA